MGKSEEHQDVLDMEVRARVDRMLAGSMEKIIAEAQAPLLAKLEAMNQKWADGPGQKTSAPSKEEWHRKICQAAEDFINSRRPVTEFWRIGRTGRSIYSLTAILKESVQTQYGKKELPAVRMSFTPPSDLMSHAMKMLGDKKLFLTRCDISEHKEVMVAKEDIEKYALNPATAAVKTGQYSIGQVLEGITRHLANRREIEDGLMSSDNFQLWFSVEYQSIQEQMKRDEAKQKLLAGISQAQHKRGDLARRGILAGAELTGAEAS